MSFRDKIDILLNCLKDLVPFGSSKCKINETNVKLSVKWIRETKRVFFFTGAGMSAGSGIPTFRGKFGLWVFGRDIALTFLILFIISVILTIIYFRSKLLIFLLVIIFLILVVVGIVAPFLVATAISTPYGWNKYPKLSWVIFKIFFFDKVVASKHNDGHKFMNYLKDVFKKDVYVITSNVDGLELNVSNTCKRVHGVIEKFYCSYCGSESPPLILDTNKKLPWLNPKCKKCGRRRMRTGCLLFNDWDHHGRPNFVKTDNIPFYFPDDHAVYFVIGTSNMVGFGIQNIPENAKIIEINLTKEPTTEIKKITKDYIYFSAPQEQVLKMMHDRLFYK